MAIVNTHRRWTTDNDVDCFSLQFSNFMPKISYEASLEIDIAISGITDETHFAKQACLQCTMVCNIIENYTVIKKIKFHC